MLDFRRGSGFRDPHALVYLLFANLISASVQWVTIVYDAIAAGADRKLDRFSFVCIRPITPLVADGYTGKIGYVAPWLAGQGTRLNLPR